MASHVIHEGADQHLERRVLRPAHAAVREKKGKRRLGIFPENQGVVIGNGKIDRDVLRAQPCKHDREA